MPFIFLLIGLFIAFAILGAVYLYFLSILGHPLILLVLLSAVGAGIGFILFNSNYKRSGDLTEEDYVKIGTLRFNALGGAGFLLVLLFAIILGYGIFVVGPREVKTAYTNPKSTYKAKISLNPSFAGQFRESNKNCNWKIRVVSDSVLEIEGFRKGKRFKREILIDRFDGTNYKGKLSNQSSAEGYINKSNFSFNGHLLTRCQSKNNSAKPSQPYKLKSNKYNVTFPRLNSDGTIPIGIWSKVIRIGNGCTINFKKGTINYLYTVEYRSSNSGWKIFIPGRRVSAKEIRLLALNNTLSNISYVRKCKGRETTIYTPPSTSRPSRGSSKPSLPTPNKTKAPNPRPNQKFPTYWNGVWIGKAQQDDGTIFKMRLTIKGNDVSIEYPTFRCGGKWDLRKVNSLAQGHAAKFVERLEYGKNRCLNNGFVNITSKNNSKVMKFKYSLLLPNKNVRFADATLRRNK